MILLNERLWNRPLNFYALLSSEHCILSVSGSDKLDYYYFLGRCLAITSNSFQDNWSNQTTGFKQDAEEAIKSFHVTRIDGQPTNKDLNQLTAELSEMAATVSKMNGGRSHGHLGMLVKEMEYQSLSTRNEPFTVPTNPGAYSTTVDPDVMIRERQIAEHKFTVKEFETYLGVKNALRQKIREAGDNEWLEGIHHQSMGFAHLTPKQTLDHLKQGGMLLDYMDVSELTTKLTEPWDGNENPATRFARDDHYERQLIKAGLPNVLCLNISQALFKVTGL